ncbi:J domain-containing protein [Stenotrophomonas sp. SY1]|uniref:J domain-containing protein n=1 Tax=Stenotrophomonas sp. SY1 TaxID=477235 RepID=UPI001E5ADDE4|nr:J domain-containing protein [Stenotrophomonas sp. SY1]MCD9087393.1 J domain-containing protein [Stenotrophomonas sp. SY1]
MSIPAFPLAWPVGWRRTPAGDRANAKFGKRVRSTQGSWNTKTELTIAQALERVRTQLQMMGIHDDDLVVSTNLELRLDGWPRSGQREPRDPGAAVYWSDRFSRGEPPRCMAIDRYDRVADNLAAVAATLEAMRAIERHGGAEILERAFTGFTALPGATREPWANVLDAADPLGSYRRLRSQHHPDNGGDRDKFERVQRAWEDYQQEACA